LSSNSAKYKVSALFLALFTTVLFAGVEFAHNHADGDCDESHCPACVVAHSLSVSVVSDDEPVIVKFDYQLAPIEQVHPDILSGSAILLSGRSPPL